MVSFVFMQIHLNLNSVDFSLTAALLHVKVERTLFFEFHFLKIKIIKLSSQSSFLLGVLLLLGLQNLSYFSQLFGHSFVVDFHLNEVVSLDSEFN